MSDWKMRVSGGLLFSDPGVDGEFFKTPKDKEATFFTDYQLSSAQLSVEGDYWSAGLQSVNGSGNTRYLRIGQNYNGAALEGRLPILYWFMDHELLKNFRIKPHLEINYGESWKVNVDEEGRVDRESSKEVAGFQWAGGLLFAADAFCIDEPQIKAGVEAAGGFLYQSDLETDVQMSGFAGGFKLFVEWK